jgi:hypothetical protein
MSIDFRDMYRFYSVVHQFDWFLTIIDRFFSMVMRSRYTRWDLFKFQKKYIYRRMIKVLIDGPWRTRAFPSHKRLWRYALTFALLFYVHFVHFSLLYWIPKQFLSARLFKNVLYKNYVKNAIILLRVYYKYFLCFSHIYSKSSQTAKI